MNLLHHLVVAENLRAKLRWVPSLRGAMLLGAIAPDAHTEVSGLERSIFHPKPGEDLVAATLKLAAPTGCPENAHSRAFLVSVIAHLVADELTREHGYHLPLHAPSGFQSIESASNEVVASSPVMDAGVITRSLTNASSECSLGPLPPEAIDRKRWEVLDRWPLTEGRGRVLIVEPLASLARDCADEAFMRMHRSHAGAALLGSWRA